MLSFILLIVISVILVIVNAHCPNACSGKGNCGSNDKCTCYVKSNGDPAYTYPDCSGRTCPKAAAWVSTLSSLDLDSNHLSGNGTESLVGGIFNTYDGHELVECANAGICDRKSGECQCRSNYDGIACERTICPNKCSNSGVCFSLEQIATNAGAKYETPWDAKMNTGCVCDPGRRGPDCSQLECPSGNDVLKGSGASEGRDCSGRGACDYTQGICSCYSGYYGDSCQYQTVLS